MCPTPTLLSCNTATSGGVLVRRGLPGSTGVSRTHQTPALNSATSTTTAMRKVARCMREAPDREMRDEVGVQYSRGQAGTQTAKMGQAETVSRTQARRWHRARGNGMVPWREAGVRETGDCNGVRLRARDAANAKRKRLRGFLYLAGAFD